MVCIWSLSTPRGDGRWNQENSLGLLQLASPEYLGLSRNKREPTWKLFTTAYALWHIHVTHTLSFHAWSSALLRTFPLWCTTITIHPSIFLRWNSSGPPGSWNPTPGLREFTSMSLIQMGSCCEFTYSFVTVWLISFSILSPRFIHLVACVRISFLIALNYIIIMLLENAGM